MKLFLTLVFIVLSIVLPQKSSLEKKYGTLKKGIAFEDGKFGEIEERIQESIVTALSKYPQLSRTRILVKYVKPSSFFPINFSVKPSIGSLFSGERLYVISIACPCSQFSIYQNASNDAIVGVLAHELAHVVQYENLNNMELASFAVSWIFNRSISEKSADSIAADHGFSKELASWTSFILENDDVPSFYKEYKRKFYLSPKNILERTKNN